METHIGKYRWRIVALLFFATTINYLDRQVVGILKPFISQDLGWTEADYGYIVTAFQIAYALGMLLTGKLLDKFGTKIGYAAAIVVWSLAGIGHALARGVLSFGFVRSLLGFGESANFPAAIKSVAEWFPKKERALATSWFNSGASVGAIAAPIIVSGITVLWGWRWAFIVTGGLGFIWLAVWFVTYKLPEHHPKVKKPELEYINSDNEEDLKINIPWSTLLKYKQTWALCFAKFLTDWVWWFYLYWVPDFLSKSQHMDIKEVVLPLIIIYVMSSVGGIAGGWLSSYFMKRGWELDKARKVTTLIFAVLVLPIVFAANVSGMWSAIIILSIGTGAHQGWSANLFTLISDIYPKSSVGSLVGMVGFIGAIGGAFAASFIGLVLQLTNSYVSIFLIAGSMYLIAWTIIKLMIPKIKPVNI